VPLHFLIRDVGALLISHGELHGCASRSKHEAISPRSDNDEIEAYVATGDPLDKAGAYAIQNVEFHPVETMQGCYASVMGLPLCHLARSLHKLDIASLTDIASACQSALGYACPISSAVLRGEMVG